MRILLLAAFLAAVAVSSRGDVLISPVFAQSNDEGGDDSGDGRGSGCDHRKEETIS